MNKTYTKKQLIKLGIEKETIEFSDKLIKFINELCENTNFKLKKVNSLKNQTIKIKIVKEEKK